MRLTLPSARFRVPRVLTIVRASIPCALIFGATATPYAQAPATAPTAAGQSAPAAPKKAPDVVFVPTPEPVVAAMLELAAVTAKDVVYDLGSGDGRIVIAAARDRGARAVGYEVRPELLQQARENATKAGVGGRTEFRDGDLFEADLSRASVITLYLLPDLNRKLMPKLQRELKPGSRVVSHAFDMGDWKPDETREVDGRRIYLWRIAGNQSQ